VPSRTSVTGSELFIVDNSDEDWKVLRYLHDWCRISKAIDCATGHFEIGALLALKDEWQKVDQLRILMGNEVSPRTRDAFLESLKQVKQRLDGSIECEKEKNDFLAGVPAIVEGIRSGKIACRLYRKDKFHAKAYITHARMEVVGSAALVGSSNLSYPGLTENIELNVQITGRPVTVLQEWYEEHWALAEDVTPEILLTIERHTREYSPFEVYVKALYEFFLGREKGQESWEANESVLYRVLSQYQKVGYHRALQIAEMRGGALLCDGVGLGKTFIALMLIEHYLHQGKRVLLLVPKSALQSVWERWIKNYLRPHYGRAVREQLYIHTHTQLEREGTISPEDYDYYRRYVDAVIVDEAHHFRNAFRRRCQRLYSLTDGKKLYLLTATPINNRLLDLYFLVCYFIPRASPWEGGRFVPKQDYFAGIGIRHLRKHFDSAEAKLDRIQHMTVDEAAMAGDFLRTDELLRSILIQRSRRFVRESERQSEAAPLFPVRKPPHVIQYSLKKVYAGLYEDLVTAFNQTQPLLTLAAYNSEAYRRGAPDESKANYQALVVGLIRTLLLKRLESSYRAFEASLEELLKKMAGFLAAHDDARFQDWVARHRRQWDTVLEHQRSRFIDEDPEDVEEEDLLEEPEEVLSPEDYDLSRLLNHVVDDMGQVVTILTKVYQRLSSETDDKLAQLARTLQTNPRLSSEKVVIFTEFRDTARYLTPS
jgi:HKD family nuclease